MNPNPMVLDIETLPLAAALDLPYPKDERSAPSNYKDPEKIAAWFEADERKWRESRVKECSVNPRLGRVLCVGMTTEDGADATVTFAKTEADEKQLLFDLWREIGVQAGELVTWNGSWDLRFILIRSMYHGLKPTVRAETIAAWFRRYSLFPHFDCRQAVNNWQTFTEGEGLHEWAAFFHLPERPETIRGLTGADVARLYADGKITTIEEYCAWDVMDTKRIYEQLAVMYDDGRSQFMNLHKMTA